MPSKLDRLVLVLNNAYEPVNVVAGKRALTLVMAGKAFVEVPSNQFIRTAHLTVQVPSVIRLMVYRRVPRANRAVSRKSIFLRDRFTCQYCHQVKPVRELTLDHVIPVSRSGRNSWENLTSACLSCNNKKGDRTPEEAGMPLLHKPARIGVHAKHRLLAGTETPEWEPYLFG